jgi:hypothetical protein
MANGQRESGTREKSRDVMHKKRAMFFSLRLGHCSSEEKARKKQGDIIISYDLNNRIMVCYAAAQPAK